MFNLFYFIIKNLIKQKSFELQIEMRYSKNHVLKINIWNSTKTKTRKKNIYIYKERKKENGNKNI